MSMPEPARNRNKEPQSGSAAFFDPPGSGMEENSEPGSEIIIPGLIFENFESVFRLKNTEIP
jgi:hypothetical protein